MNDENNLKNIIPIAIIVVMVVLIVYVPKLFNKKSDMDENFQVIEKSSYAVNEYIPIFVDDEQMARKYLNDYINNVLYDLDGSYELLNEKYRNVKFDSLEDYKEYINSLNLSLSTEIDKFATYEKLDYKYYDVYDKAGNRFIFRTNGVMQYEVLFEDFKL